ncbi:hypothetical protein [Limosilactobacillus mucosae]|uniref:hypothetical protein n=1 Tax=Limosilactobacillus mucosae TaxID=97478 RepID=UPI000FFC9D43|nr:hypothetical protein [Limosilactobacillus mucosae]RXA55432.1 hypothetical protein EQ839_09000 [Limosilactobacillus mucosae]
MTIKEVVEKYRVSLYNPSAEYRAENNLPDGELLYVENIDLLKSDDMSDYIREHKQEIINFLKEKEAKIASIPGLKEIEASEKERQNFRHNFNVAFDSENTAGIQANLKMPDSDPAALRKKYPQADAYLQMKDLAGSYNFELSAIGNKAIEMVIDGDWQKALEYADNEQQKLVEKHQWD